MTLWATFAPCFLWIFVGAPYVERLNAEPRLRSALAAVTSAVVGVILNLTVWFAVHVLFASVGERFAGPLRLLIPDLPRFHGPRRRCSRASPSYYFSYAPPGVVTTLGICGALALAWHALK